MDDKLFEASTIDIANELIRKVSETLDKGELPLTKWTSSWMNTLINLQKAENDMQILSLHFNL